MSHLGLNESISVCKTRRKRGICACVCVCAHMRVLKNWKKGQGPKAGLCLTGLNTSKEAEK